MIIAAFVDISPYSGFLGGSTENSTLFLSMIRFSIAAAILVLI
jgi:hypothetical protein